MKTVLQLGVVISTVLSLAFAIYGAYLSFFVKETLDSADYVLIFQALIFVAIVLKHLEGLSGKDS